MVFGSNLVLFGSKLLCLEAPSTYCKSHPPTHWKVCIRSQHCIIQPTHALEGVHHNITFSNPPTHWKVPITTLYARCFHSKISSGTEAMQVFQTMKESILQNKTAICICEAFGLWGGPTVLISAFARKQTHSIDLLATTAEQMEKCNKQFASSNGPRGCLLDVSIWWCKYVLHL